jgi:hypothetical protein
MTLIDFFFLLLQEHDQFIPLLELRRMSHISADIYIIAECVSGHQLVFPHLPS